MQHTPPVITDAICLNVEDQAAIGGRPKRLFDFSCALVALTLLIFVFLLLSIIIKVTSKGPVLFRHERLGRNGRQFECLKFRTMIPDADRVLKTLIDNDPDARLEWLATQKLRRDPRITGVGRVLRATSLDELPQIWNVLIGDMSFVGPRPIVRDEIHRYGPAIRQYYRTRPGLTGPWQISGRNEVAYQQRVVLDHEYAESWSFRTDLLIILKTIPAVVRLRGAC